MDPAQVHKVEKQLMQSKEEHEMEIRGIQNQAEQMKAEVSELKNATTHSIAHSSGRVHSLQVRATNPSPCPARIFPYGSRKLLCGQEGHASLLRLSPSRPTP